MVSRVMFRYKKFFSKDITQVERMVSDFLTSKSQDKGFNLVKISSSEYSLPRDQSVYHAVSVVYTIFSEEE